MNVDFFTEIFSKNLIEVFPHLRSKSTAKKKQAFPKNGGLNYRMWQKDLKSVAASRTKAATARSTTVSPPSRSPTETVETVVPGPGPEAGSEAGEP